MIRCEKVTKIYPGHQGNQPIVALEDISFEVKEKEFVSIVGRSGAGKTTLLKLLSGEEKPTRGKIFFEGEEITKLKPEKLPLLRRKMGIIFQDYKLLPRKTAAENIAYAMEVSGFSQTQIKNDLPRVLAIVGLGERANNFPDELSGGEKQRVAIARALIHRPKVILADEPTGNLDPYHTLEIINLLVKLNQLGTTIILATHNKEIINSLEKRVISLEKGRIIKDESRGRFIL